METTTDSNLIPVLFDTLTGCALRKANDDQAKTKGIFSVTINGVTRDVRVKMTDSRAVLFVNPNFLNSSF